MLPLVKWPSRRARRKKRSNDCWRGREQSFERGGTMTRLPDEEFMDRIADGVELIAPEPAPARLKAKILSALLARQEETGPLLSLTHSHTMDANFAFLNSSCASLL